MTTDKIIAMAQMLRIAEEKKNKETAARYSAAIGETLNKLIQEMQTWPQSPKT